MLKVCWDCFFGTGQNEVVPGSQTNGQALGDIMSQRRNEMIFRLPRPLNNGDMLEVKGNMNFNPEKFSVALCTGQYNIDYTNVACEVEASFSDQDSIKLRTVLNGIPDESLFGNNIASKLFIGAEFAVKFTIMDSAILIYVGDSILEPYYIKHSIQDITYLSLSNDVLKVNELKFEFSN